ncbi:hypothetical protein KC19_1G225600 [Ceratodon purpureus]|uniref:N-acetylglucosaminylphosphatidylinositol deacetylase n=1 Tax=Ceratodon purpureus TaxID=3225 RepID=A0A8T0JB97_CERPU|nr:hypothetical protein KC19_1G225600 [Ceratodon purpureus]
MLLAGLALGIALLVPFFYFVHRSPALQPQPLPSVQGISNGGKINVLLVVAHPDDESMFFGPTLLSLAQLGVYNIRALCFSTGNADGLGSVRKSEMATACSVLKIPTENVDVVDHPALQDGFSSLWDQTVIVNLLRKTVEDHNVQVILTFDSHGISGHPNHRAVHSGVRETRPSMTRCLSRVQSIFVGRRKTNREQAKLCSSVGACEYKYVPEVLWTS